jgi:hypothetical protein
MRTHSAWRTLPAQLATSCIYCLRNRSTGRSVLIGLMGSAGLSHARSSGAVPAALRAGRAAPTAPIRRGAPGQETDEHCAMAQFPATSLRLRGAQHPDRTTAPTARRRLGSVRDMLFSIAGIALIVLKLTGVITWSWWWVLSPMWISATFLALLASGLIIAMIVAHWHLRRLRRHFTDRSAPENR